MKRILIANRGEIARRVIRTAHTMGLETVAVYSEPDADAPHTREASLAVALGGSTAAESYLVMDKILQAARDSGADAIHPGYGFLSENADFARAVVAAGMRWIGPPPAAIELMGSKRQSKIEMLRAGVPCVPGYEGDQQDDAALIAEAEAIGFPVMIKASAGGGGRGMRMVEDAADMAAAIQTARSEALSAFGNGELILEKAVLAPRHVEIQIFADTHGNAVYLGERDCSVQRRHQKVIEEAPCPVLANETRVAMGEAAVAAARACQYEGAGTVEFLLDDAQNFYFLEMNTRLQVEHPVTEMITGQDLVQWQILVAQGQELPLQQDQICLDGHAMEIRLYAEDTRQEFLPQTGQVQTWAPATLAGVRYDSAIEEGSVISPFYDPMIAKIIAHGRDREQARTRLIQSLLETRVFGTIVNRDFLLACLRHPAFANGEATTHFIADHLANHPTIETAAIPPRAYALAAAARALDTMRDPASLLAYPGLAPAADLQAVVMADAFDAATDTPEHARTLQIGFEGNAQLTGLQIADTSTAAEPANLRIVLQNWEPGMQQARLVVDGEPVTLSWAIHGYQIDIFDGTSGYTLHDISHRPASALSQAGTGNLLSPMDGAVVAVHAAPGDTVTAGDTVLTIEAMKMEHPVRADVDGTVSEICVAQGDQVKGKALLAVIAPATQAES